MGRFEGKSALVVGGAGGIGRAVAWRLAEEGARVAVADLNAEGASRTAEEIEGLALAVDVTDEAGVAQTVSRARDELGVGRRSSRARGCLPPVRSTRWISTHGTGASP
jgi:3-hydroxybutyrate dehydrogenase